MIQKSIDNQVKNTRNMAISATRCVAMVFIILCHFMQYYDSELAWWFNVGVHMFLFMSGFLYGNKDIDSPVGFVAKNLKKILVPYYCFLIPAIALYYFFARDVITKQNALMALFCSGTIEGIEHLWFVSYILFCYILTPYLSDLVKKWRGISWLQFLIRCFIALAVGFVLSWAFQSYFGYNCVICYLLGYFASAFLHQYGQQLFNRLSYIVIVLAFVVNAFRIYCKYIINFQFIGFGPFEVYAHVLLGMGLVLLGMIVFKNVKENIVLKTVDKYSYYIYTVHQLFILSPFTLLALTQNDALNCVLAIVAICIAAVVLKFVSDKIVLGSK